MLKIKKTIVFAFLALSLAFYVLPIAAQTKGTIAVREIEEYCKNIDAFTKTHKNPQFVFADTADYTEKKSKPRWKKFASVKSLEKFRETTETYSIAYSWRKNGKIVRSNFTLFSPSGDWSKYVYLYFRADGTLAKAESELRTFYGYFIVLNDIYFDDKGKILKKTTKYLDLKTEKPKMPSKDDFADNGDNFKLTEYYKTASKLPFNYLLKR